MQRGFDVIFDLQKGLHVDFGPLRLGVVDICRFFGMDEDGVIKAYAVIAELEVIDRGPGLDEAHLHVVAVAFSIGFLREGEVDPGADWDG